MLTKTCFLAVAILSALLKAYGYTTEYTQSIASNNIEKIRLAIIMEEEPHNSAESIEENGRIFCYKDAWPKQSIANNEVAWIVAIHTEYYSRVGVVGESQRTRTIGSDMMTVVDFTEFFRKKKRNQRLKVEASFNFGTNLEDTRKRIRVEDFNFAKPYTPNSIFENTLIQDNIFKF